MQTGNRFLLFYSGVLTAALAVAAFSRLATGSQNVKFDQIEVQRVNVVEPEQQ